MGCKDTGIKKSEFVAKTQFLYSATYIKFKTFYSSQQLLNKRSNDYKYIRFQSYMLFTLVGSELIFNIWICRMGRGQTITLNGNGMLGKKTDLK